MLLLASDILPLVCSHLTCLTHLNRLSRVNKSLKGRIHHASHEHWLRIGRAICGEAHWNEALFGRTPDGRYTAKLHMCPWLSIPERFELQTFRAYGTLDTTVELRRLEVSEMVLGCAIHTTNFVSPQIKNLDDTPPLDTRLYVHIHVHESPYAVGGTRVIAREARAREGFDVLLRYPEDPAGDFTDDVALDLQVQLESDAAFMRFTRRYGLGELSCVHIVHARMFAAVFNEGRTWRHSTVLFLSMNDHTRILHEFRLKDSVPECVAFRPGEMWFADSSGRVHYYGPRADNRTQPYTLKGHGLISRAFFATANGRAEEAVHLLRPLDIQALHTLFIPKTTLTLFDIAADPDGRAMQARDGSVDTPLLPDAQYLLQIEPRFAHGVHMMKRAIRAWDLCSVRALVAKGCPWISHNDVVDALAPGVVYNEAMDRLRLCGLKVTFRY